MKLWPQFPFVRLILPLIAGVILNQAYGRIYSLPLWSILLPLPFLIILHRMPGAFPGYSRRWIFGTVLNLFLVLTGYSLMDLNAEVRHQMHLGNLNVEPPALWSGVIAEPPSPRTNSLRMLINVDRCIVAGEIRGIRGRTLVYAAIDSLAQTLAYGDRILFSTDPQRIRPPANPGEFNYAGYLANKKVYHQVFLRSGSYSRTGTGEGIYLMSMAFQIRDKFLNVLRNYGLTGREYAVAAALLIGYDDHLDPEQRREFSGAGAMHILCVSGLHVGVVFIIADKLFFFLKRKRKGKYLKPILVILVIWVYALLTGLAPSVTRASLMFSLVTAGKALNRRSHILNTLAAAAFLQLIVNPATLFETGFQLSYAAVTGIVTLQPHFQVLYSDKPPFVKYFLDLIMVSLAAQIATGPVSVYYFHQFPNYFLLTNLLVIPLSGILIYTGVTFLFLSPFPIIGKIAAVILTTEIKLLNEIVAFIEGLPGAVSRELFLSSFSLAAIYALTVTLFLWFLYRRITWFRISCILFVLIAADFSALAVRRNKRKMLIVHQINRHTAISLTEGKEFRLMADSGLITDPAKLNIVLDGYRIRHGLSPVIPEGLSSRRNGDPGNGFFCFRDKRLLVLTPELKIPPPGSRIRLDYVILSGNVNAGARQLSELFPGALFIIDGSASQWKAKRWSEDLIRLGKPFHSTREKGAWVPEL